MLKTDSNQKIGLLFTVVGLLSPTIVATSHATETKSELMEAVSNRFFVAFEPTTQGRPGQSQENAKSYLSDWGLQFVDYLEQIDVYVATYEGTSRSEKDRTLSRLKEAKEAGLLRYYEKDTMLELFDASPLLTPNDPHWDEQKWVYPTQITEAWDKTKGNRAVVVGIIDTGTQLNHPDLKNNNWINPKEIPDNGIDDDGNKLIDDVHGWDYSENDNNPDDSQGHGTHVAGIIGAQGNNGVGIAGATWNVSLMHLRLFNDQGNADGLGAVRHILYAGDHAVRIVNCSWGGGGYSETQLKAIDYSYKKGTLFVFAAGNSNSNNDLKPAYPASYNHPGIISVAATEKNKWRAGYSNWGFSTVDLAAPGTDIFSTWINSGYHINGGTSMAAPMVTGAGALMLALNPNLSPQQLKAGLLNAALPKKYLKNLVASEGELNFLEAVNQVGRTYQVWPSRLGLLPQATYDLVPYGFRKEAALEWSSSDPNVATVTPTGTVTAIKDGTVIMTARDPATGMKGTSTITVKNPNANDGGGGGCQQAQQNLKMKPRESLSAAVSFSLPFFAGFWVRRRRRS